MRARISPRSVAALALAGVLTACGGSSPTAPGGNPAASIQIATGPQVLRILLPTSCAEFIDARSLPFVYTSVTVTKAGSEWIATASSPEAGDVELRFRESDGALAGFVPLAGTIKGSASHLAEFSGALPAWEARVSFGNDGGATVTAVAFAASPTTPVGAISGIGSGTVTMSAGTGATCTSNTFSWSLTSRQ